MSSIIALGLVLNDHPFVCCVAVHDVHVETATEAKEPPPPDISQLCTDTFRKTADYLEGELAGLCTSVCVCVCVHIASLTKSSFDK